MRTSTLKFSKSISIYALLALMITITSCGSFDAVSYNDGIYGDSYEEEEIEEVSYEENSGSYYKNLFAEKAEQYGQNFSQDSVFTDVDNYSSQSYDQANPDYTSNYGGGESGFGENPNSVVINYYDNGWNNWGYNTGFAWGWQPGIGWNSWNRPFGWNRPWGWNTGYAWGNPWLRAYGWNSGFGWNGFYGGWNGFYGGWNNGWGNYYNRNNYAFVNGNRNYYGRNAIGNSSRNSRGTTSVNNRNTTRRNVGRGTNGVSRGRSTTATNSRSTSRNSTGVSRRSSTRSSNTTARSNSSSRSSRSSTTGRSSSSTRSSSSSTRSSSSSSGRSSSGTRSSGRRG